MTDDDQAERPDGSRRRFMKRGALATAGVTVGFPRIGTVAAQEDDITETDADAVMFNHQFRPGAQLRVTSPVVEPTPELEGDLDGLFDDYEVRIGRYLVSGEQVNLFVRRSASIEEGDVYELQGPITPLEGGAAEGLVTVAFTPVPAEDRFVTTDDNGVRDGVLLKPGEDYDLIDGGGIALVPFANFAPESLFRVTSEVLNWVPRADVRGSDLFTDYNTHHAEFLATDAEFHMYPAHDASVEKDAVYVMQKVFDLTDPEGYLVTIEFDRVDTDDLHDDLR